LTFPDIVIAVSIKYLNILKASGVYVHEICHIIHGITSFEPGGIINYRNINRTIPSYTVDVYLPSQYHNNGGLT